MNFYSQELAHHGIKGMKWGVRRTPEQLGRKPSGRRGPHGVLRKTTSKSKKPTSKTRTDSKKPAVHRISEMSDDELRQKINRIQMERTYASLTAKQIFPGEKFVKEVLYDSAKSTAKHVVTAQMTKMVESAINGGHGGGSGGSGGGS